MDRRTDGQTDRWTDEQMDRRTDGQTDIHTYIQTDRQTDRLMDRRQIDGTLGAANNIFCGNLGIHLKPFVGITIVKFHDSFLCKNCQVVFKDGLGWRG